MIKDINIISREISLKFKEMGMKCDSDLYYVKSDRFVRLCTKTRKGNYLVITGPKTTKLLRKNECRDISSALTLSEINDLLKYYSSYFKTYYDEKKNTWMIDKNIFKIYFLNHSKRKYMDDFIKLSKKTFDKEIDLMGEFLLFLIKSEFIDINDIN